MKEIKTYEEMNKRICGLLRLAGDNVSLYAAKRIAELEAENDKLRARLANAVELPTIYEHTIYPFVESLYTETIYYVVYKENGRIMTINCGKDKDRAEARLAEIKAEAKLKEQGGNV